MIPTDFHSYFFQRGRYTTNQIRSTKPQLLVFLSVNHPTLEGTHFWYSNRKGRTYGTDSVCVKKNMSHVSLTKSILVGITDHQGVVANFRSIPISTYINHQQVGVSLWIAWKGLISWEKKIISSYRFFLKPIHWVSKNATPPFHLMIWFQPGSFGTHRGPRGPRGCHAAGMGMDS